MEDETELVEPIEVELSTELLDDIDAFALEHGYETRSAVVRDALQGSC